MRIASLVGKTVSGDLISLAVGEGNDIAKVVDAYRSIVAANGLATVGRREVKLADINLLANRTAGGELKSHRRFTHLPPQQPTV